MMCWRRMAFPMGCSLWGWRRSAGGLRGEALLFQVREWGLLRENDKREAGGKEAISPPSTIKKSTINKSSSDQQILQVLSLEASKEVKNMSSTKGGSNYMMGRTRSTTSEQTDNEMTMMGKMSSMGKKNMASPWLSGHEIPKRRSGQFRIEDEMRNSFF